MTSRYRICMSEKETKEITDFVNNEIEKLKQMSYSELEKEKKQFLESKNKSHISSRLRKSLPKNNFKLIDLELKRYQYAIDIELKAKAPKN